MHPILDQFDLWPQPSAAKAIAKELNIPLVTCSSKQYVNMKGAVEAAMKLHLNKGVVPKSNIKLVVAGDATVGKSGTSRH